MERSPNHPHINSLTHRISGLPGLAGNQKWKKSRVEHVRNLIGNQCEADTAFTQPHISLLSIIIRSIIISPMAVNLRPVVQKTLPTLEI